ncbi:MAG: hypothetical protein LIP00_13025 [Parabacteroides sp.]|nr:hypothetical protein [Parabacteroides sp.]
MIKSNWFPTSRLPYDAYFSSIPKIEKTNRFVLNQLAFTLFSEYPFV